MKKFLAAVCAASMITGIFGGAAVFADETENTVPAVVETAEPLTGGAESDIAAPDEVPSAEETTDEIPAAEPAPETAAPDEESDEVSEAPAVPEDSAPVETEAVSVTGYTLNFNCVLDGWPRYDSAVFNIYSAADELLGSHTVYIGGTDGFSLDYDLPAAPVGTIYYLEVSGVDSIDYYTENYPLPLTEKLPLYTYINEADGTLSSSADMTLHIRTQDDINIYVDGKYIGLSSPAIFEGSSIIAPLSEIAEAIGISDCTYFPEYDSVKVKTGDSEMLVNIGFSYITVFGEDKQLNVPVKNINSLTYIELRPFVESFGSSLEFFDSGEYIDIHLTKSPIALESIAALEQRINESGVGSSTDYLIWVNKQKFRCTVFEGSRGNWKRLKDFTVGIGAPSSETITGTFEYSQAQNMWPYEHYYVGPVMIFYGNYALHSTLLRYDGTPYNNNVGVKLSLGCVRCQAKYINWMSQTVPLGTRVYITES